MFRRGVGFGGGRRSLRGGGVIPYDPAKEAGYIHDLWADRFVTTSGANVTQWDDASGAIYVPGTSPTFSATGLGSHGGVTFTAASSQNLLGSNHAHTGGSKTVVLFCDPLTATAATRVVIGFTLAGVGKLYLYQHDASGNVAFFDGTASRAVGAATTGPQVLTWSLVSGGTATVYRGETSIGTVACSALSNVDDSVFGRNPTTTSQYANMTIGRLLVYDGILDSAALSRVWQWGADYYGISL